MFYYFRFIVIKKIINFVFYFINSGKMINKHLCVYPKWNAHRYMLFDVVTIVFLSIFVYSIFNFLAIMNNMIADLTHATYSRDTIIINVDQLCKIKDKQIIYTGKYVLLWNNVWQKFSKKLTNHFQKMFFQTFVRCGPPFIQTYIE